MNTIKPSPDDELHFESDQQIKECFEQHEVILMSCSLSKYNKRQRCQERAMLITSKAIYNVNRFEFLAHMISFFKSSYAIRRRINIEKVAAITVSELSDEFVIHVKDEYDYRYSSPQRDKILEVFLKSYEMNVEKPLNFFYTEKLNLHEFVTTEDDMRSGIIRMPTENPIYRDLDPSNKRIESKAVTKAAFIKDFLGTKLTLEDFEFRKVMAGGSWKTMLVEKKETKQIYAIKTIDKDEQNHLNCEKYILEKSQSPFIIKLEFAFKTPEKFVLGMRFMRGGELFQYLRRSKRFNEERAKFYAAEVILGLEHLHHMGMIYRNLKPEKILMDEEGHICLRDFGMSKKLELGQRTRSVVGTPEYLSPEVVKEEEYGHSVDWWALGILVYEMLIGIPPFYNRSQDTRKMLDAIRDKDARFPTKVSVGEDAKDFILQLLCKDPKERLGSEGGADEVKKHKWLVDINWDLLVEKKVDPPFKPELIDENEFDDIV